MIPLKFFHPPFFPTPNSTDLDLQLTFLTNKSGKAKHATVVIGGRSVHGTRISDKRAPSD